MPFEAFGHTHAGKVREQNEDSYLCIKLPREGSDCHLFAVADGMGGHAGGQIASGLAISCLRAKVSAVPTSGDSADGHDLLRRAFEAANREILRKAGTEPELHSMGTTLVAALAVGSSVTLASVGDSRAYLARGATLQQLTQDHSWKEEQAQRFELSAEKIAASPFRHMLTRSVGFQPEIEVDLFDVECEGADVLLLCSDGIHNLVPEPVLLETISTPAEPEAACRRLIELANQAGGFDNATCVVARFAPPSEAEHEGVTRFMPRTAPETTD